MKYRCSKCDFHWIGTSYKFDEEVREHEKTHKKGETNDNL